MDPHRKWPHNSRRVSASLQSAIGLGTNLSALSGKSEASTIRHQPNWSPRTSLHPGSHRAVHTPGSRLISCDLNISSKNAVSLSVAVNARNWIGWSNC
jgi:hypothetical protein